MKKQGGFTLVETLVVIAIIGILSAIALPDFWRWLESQQYRKVARTVASGLRLARSTAITRNRECRVEIELTNCRYRIMLGERSNNSSDFTTVVQNWENLPKGIDLRRNSTCTGTTDLKLQFNPNGTSSTGYLCIMKDPGTGTLEKVFRVGIGYATTGWVRID